ncbi:MAG: ferrous iron transport protein B [Saprospiraceae bacterium]
MSRLKNIALLGNPNSGKSTLFNLLTGLHQKISNFPGVTVEKKSGTLTVEGGEQVQITDLPGTYSLFPNSLEEKLVVDILTNRDHPNFPDLIIYVADITQIERHLLLAVQIQQLGIPMFFVSNMVDLISSTHDVKALSDYLKVPVITSSTIKNTGLDYIVQEIFQFTREENISRRYVHTKTCPLSEIEKKVVQQISDITGVQNPYLAKLMAHHAAWLNVCKSHKEKIISITTKLGFQNMDSQVKEVMNCYDDFLPVTQAIQKEKEETKTRISTIDRIVTHRVIGPFLFFTIMLFVFQAIYAWATIPMDLIEGGFTLVSTWFSQQLPEHFLSDLFVDGILAGLSGVLIFIPQIAILFILISLLEESGYMSRAVYMFDTIMRKFGMNGRSIVSLVSSGACAIPAIMSTRTIQNQKERLITILVSPLISCSARLPVYAILVGFVVPDIKVWGFLNAAGLVFMGLYLLGILGALGSAFVFSRILKTSESSYLMLELPQYKNPNWKNVWLTTKEKVMSFVREAGKIILIISMVLWVLSSFGPGENIAKAEEKATLLAVSQNLNEEETGNLINQHQLEASYAGIMGKWIEPAIRPLGFDWKMGIALITSFAAREVFVGTMATIYSIGQDNETDTLREKMKKEKKKDGITPMYNTATALSLLIFYVFAMQCMSTLAVTKKETGSWKWPIIQFTFMGLMAYLGSLMAYSILA